MNSAWLLNQMFCTYHVLSCLSYIILTFYIICLYMAQFSPPLISLRGFSGCSWIGCREFFFFFVFTALQSSIWIHLYQNVKWAQIKSLQYTEKKKNSNHSHSVNKKLSSFQFLWVICGDGKPAVYFITPETSMRPIGTINTCMKDLQQ